MLVFIASLVSVLLVSALQMTNIIFVGDIKPNLIFALFAVLAHYNKNWTRRGILVLLSAVIVKFSPVITWLDIIFVLILFLVIALVDYLPWRKAINSVSAVALGTVIMSLSSFNLSLLTLEIIINSVLTLIFLTIFEYSYGKKKETIKNRL